MMCSAASLITLHAVARTARQGPGIRARRHRDEGFAVARAASLGEAVQEARRDPPVDVVIADYHLQKGETGIEVIAAVRALVGEQLGAVLVSGDTSSTVRQISPDDRLRLASKPIRADELLALICELLPPKRDAGAG